MDLKLISKDKRSIEIEISRKEEVLVLPLEHALLQDPKTDYAAFTKKHPFIDDPRIRVIVKDGKPETALKRASRTILRDLGDFESKLNKDSKKFKNPVKKAK